MPTLNPWIVSPLEDQRSGLKQDCSPDIEMALTVSPLEDQRSGLKHLWRIRPDARSKSFSAGRPAEWIETGSARIAVLNRGSFSAGRPAEWIETARADALTRIGQVSPLEDQRSGLKLAHKHTTHKGKVMFLRWKTSGVD